MNDMGASYYDRSRSWADDREVQIARSRTVAWIAAAIAVGVALLEAVAIILLTPLKTVVPMTLLVDRQTGYVQALDPLKPNMIGSNEALTSSFLVQYVLAREGYDFTALQSDYRKVALWSAGPARSSYLAVMQSADVRSPVHLYGRESQVRVTVKSVSPLAPRASLVRFDTDVVHGSGQIDTHQSWAAVVRYRFTNAPMRTEDRFLNPLGFQVLAYRRDPEVIPLQSPAAKQAPSSELPVAAAPGSVAIILPARNVPLGSPLIAGGHPG